MKNGLFIETYNVGILGNLTSEYITDSSNFRIYSGTFDDENGIIWYNLEGDTLTIEVKEQDEGYATRNLKTKTLRKFSLSKLKKEKIYQ